jgi:hypothetical protein
MLRHVVLLTFGPDVEQPRIAAVVDALSTLPSAIPEIRSYEVAVDAGLGEGNATVAVVATFDDEHGWRTYTDHPAHRRVIVEQILPILAARTAVQYRVAGA